MPISGTALYQFLKGKLDTATTELDTDLEDLIPLELWDPEIPGAESAFADDDSAQPMFGGWGGGGGADQSLLAGPQGTPTPPPSPPSKTGPQPAPIFQPAEDIGFLERPQRALSELLMGGDPLRALLKGEATKPSLGYALFEEAQQPGFQAADIGAFVVDFATDPLNLLLSGVGIKGLKALGGLAYKPQVLNFFEDAARTASLLKSPKAQRAWLAKVVEGPGRKVFKTPKGQLIKGAQIGEAKGLGLSGEWRHQLLQDIEMDLGKNWGRTTSGGKEAWLTWDNIPDEDIGAVMSKLMGIQYRMQPAETTAFGNMRRFMGSKFMPVTSVLKTHAGEWGKKMGMGIDAMMSDYLIGYGNMTKSFLTKADDLGLLGRMAEKERMATTILAEAGGKRATPAEIMNVLMEWGGEKAGRGGAKILKEGMEGTLDELMELTSKPQVREMGQHIRELMDYYQTRFSTFQDAGGRVFKVVVQGAKGKDRIQPMANHMIENYVYHMWHPDQLKRGSRAYEQFVTNQAKRLGVDKEVAAMLVEEGARSKLNVIGALRYARQSGLGGYELDPAIWLTKYIDHAEYSLALANKFGVGGEDYVKMSRMLKEAGYLSESWLNDIRDVVLRRQTKDYNASELIRKLTAFQVVTKMGIGSTISNMSQNINTIARDGLVNFMRGVTRSHTTEGQKFGAVAYNRAIQDSLYETMFGAAPHKLASRYLDATGFGFIEKWNRFFAANSATVTTERMVQKYLSLKPQSREWNRIRGRLMEYGVRLEDLRELDKGITKALSTQTMERVALRGSEVTQHATNWHQLPQIWRTPTARLALQYKNFAYNQTRFVFQEIFRPAIQYVSTSGAEGTIAPLLRFAPLFIGGGAAVAYLRDFVRMPFRELAKGTPGDIFNPKDWDMMEKAFWNSEDPLAAMARDTLMVGSIGIMGDAFQAAERGQLMQWAAGPTIGDLTEGVSRATAMGVKAYKGKDVRKDFHNFRNWMMRRALPGVAPHVPYDVDLSEFFYGD